MELTPELHVLESYRHDRLCWLDALGEWIDNGFDAGALSVTIEFGQRAVQISDDGEGLPEMSRMYRLGSHRRGRHTSLGKFGVGSKNAAAWAGRRVFVRSTHGGVTREVTIGPGDIVVKDGRWIGPDPIERTALPGEKGTIVRVESCRKAPPRESLGRLGLIFMPALNNGKQILLKMNGKRKPIEAYREPLMQDVVADKFLVRGKPVEIEIGILRDGQAREYPGFLLCYGHRVIDTTSIGVKEFSCARLSGKIILGEGWSPTKNKNALSDNSEELADAIHERIRWICQRAETLSESIASKSLRLELEDMLNDSLKSAKSREKRKHRDNEPGESSDQDPNKPKKRGKRGKASDFDSSKPGSVDVDDGVKKGTGIKMDWYTAKDGDTLGRYDSPAKTVLLNDANAYLIRAKRQRNLEALYGSVMGIYLYHESTNKGRQRLAFEFTDFLSAWGKVMNDMHFAEDQDGQSKAV